MGVPLYKDHSQHVPVHAHMLHTLSRQVHHIGISMRCRFGADGNVTLRPHTSSTVPRDLAVHPSHSRIHARTMHSQCIGAHAGQLHSGTSARLIGWFGAECILREGVRQRRLAHPLMRSQACAA